MSANNSILYRIMRFVNTFYSFVLLFYDIVILKVFCNNVSMRKERYCMTKREVQKLIVINKTIDGILTIRKAAQALKLSERQIFLWF